MTAGEVAAVVVSIAVAILAVGLLFALGSVARTMKELRLSVEEFRREAVPLLGEMRGTVSRAHGELERVDGILASAESVTATVDSASRLAYLFFSNPVVKILAFGSGTARAARRLRRGT